MLSQGHRRMIASMRCSPLLLLLFAMLDCGSGTESSKTPVETEGNQAQPPRAVTTDKQIASLTFSPFHGSILRFQNASYPNNSHFNWIKVGERVRIRRWECQ